MCALAPNCFHEIFFLFYFFFSKKTPLRNFFIFTFHLPSDCLRFQPTIPNVLQPFPITVRLSALSSFERLHFHFKSSRLQQVNLL